MASCRCGCHATCLDVEHIDRIADAVVARLERPRSFADVRQFAELLGISRDVVYQHADEWGAIRAGTRLLFDVDDALRRMRRQPTPDRPVETATTPRRRHTTRSAVELLPIRGQR